MLFISSCSSSSQEGNSGEEGSTESDATVSDKDQFGVWAKATKVDKFGDEAEGFTYHALFKGSMSNSATNNEDVCVRVDVNGDNVYCRFLEYCSIKASLPPTGYINIDFKGDDGEVITKQLLIFDDMLAGSDGEFLNLIKTNKSLKLLVDLGRMGKSYSKTKYVFSITSDGLEAFF